MSEPTLQFPTFNQSLPEAATALRQRAAIAAYASSGVVSEACKLANIDRSTWYEWAKDAAFAAAAKEAFEESTDRLVQALHERAISKSDIAAFFLLKARHPETYRDDYTSNKWTGALNITVTHRVVKSDGRETIELARQPGKAIEDGTATRIGAIDAVRIATTDVGKIDVDVGKVDVGKVEYGPQS